MAAPVSVLQPVDDGHAECRARLAEAGVKIANLEVALTTRRKIGTAIGILMATYKLTEDEAFDMLVVASQRTHQKLRDIADEVVLTGHLNWGSAS